MDKLLLRLRKTAVKGQAFVEGNETRLDEEDEVERLYLKWRGDRGSSEHGKRPLTIPTFYQKSPNEEDVLQLKLREDARATLLQRRSEQLLDNEQLKALYVILDEQRTCPFDSDESMLGWDSFCAASEKASPLARRYFSPIVFAKLQQSDPYGRISMMSFFNYVMRKVWLQQTRIGLSMYDATGDGFLREPDLESYIREMIPTLPQLNGLEKSFHSFYICTAVRKFFFFLDPLRTNRIRIQDVLACSFLDELLELRDEELGKDAQDSNWFSAPSALRVYGQYLNLDLDHNGMLSKNELARYGTGTLTSVFVDQVFQVCLTYYGEMDYKTYLDFVLALENRREPQALQYLFRILDVQHVGYLNGFSLNFFFRAIQQQLRSHCQELVSFQDIMDELFDMVKPKLPDRITLQDLIDCGQGHTVVSILIDLNGFWTHENREVLVADSSSSSSTPSVSSALPLEEIHSSSSSGSSTNSSQAAASQD